MRCKQCICALAPQTCILEACADAHKPPYSISTADAGCVVDYSQLSVPAQSYNPSSQALASLSCTGCLPVCITSCRARCQDGGKSFVH